MSRSLILFLFLIGCSSLPPVPRHVQYGVHADIQPPGFYGVDSESKAHIYQPFDNPQMKAAQCLTAQDYKAFTEWVQSVIKIAQQHCK